MGNSILTVPEDVAAHWLSRWDRQQEGYVADREERFAVLCDVVEAGLAEVAEPVVLDLGCGPGSLAARLHERLPRATVIGIDSDPLLLGLARARYGDGLTWVDADLGDPSWRADVPATVHAAVSTTALHWLPAPRLGALYAALAELLVPGGLLVNGDHLGVGDDRLARLAAVVRDRRAARAGVAQDNGWAAWWDEALTDPALANLTAERRRRTEARVDTAAGTVVEGDDKAVHHHGNGLSLAAHRELLTAAGFAASGALWQVGDDHVLVGVK